MLQNEREKKLGGENFPVTSSRKKKSLQLPKTNLTQFSCDFLKPLRILLTGLRHQSPVLQFRSWEFMNGGRESLCRNKRTTTQRQGGSLPAPKGRKNDLAKVVKLATVSSLVYLSFDIFDWSHAIVLDKKCFLRFLCGEPLANTQFRRVCFRTFWEIDSIHCHSCSQFILMSKQNHTGPFVGTSQIVKIYHTTLQKDTPKQMGGEPSLQQGLQERKPWCRPQRLRLRIPWNASELTSICARLLFTPSIFPL